MLIYAARKYDLHNNRSWKDFMILQHLAKMGMDFWIGCWF